MKFVVPSSTDQSVIIRILDSTTFLPVTNVTSASAGLALVYKKGATGATTAITEADLATEATAHTDGGMIHTNTGYYRIDLPDAAVPTAENEVTLVSGAVTGGVILGAVMVGRVTPLAPSGTLTAVTTVNGLAADVITAASIAANAIGSSELASTAVDEIVDAVWDELIAGHLTANTTGARLNSAGAAADPWSTALPGSYADGTAGEILGGMDGLSPTTRVVVANPVAVDSSVTIYRGDGYDNDETRSLEWSTTSAATWPTLTGATITTSIEQADGTATTFTGSVVTATGATKKVRQELTAAQTAALDAGTWRLTVVATVVGTSGTVTLVDTVATVIAAAS